MPLPINRPFSEEVVYARTTSIGATPVAASTVAVAKGLLQRAFAFSEGASTGTIAVAVSVNGGSTVATISFTGGSNASGSIEINTPVSVVEGDLITFTPSGGAGATIPGHFYAVIR
jgi:hypothetical protein